METINDKHKELRDKIQSKLFQEFKQSLINPECPTPLRDVVNELMIDKMPISDEAKRIRKLDYQFKKLERIELYKRLAKSFKENSYYAQKMKALS